MKIAAAALPLLVVAAACSTTSPAATSAAAFPSGQKVTATPPAASATAPPETPDVAGAVNMRLSCDIKPGTRRATLCDAAPYRMQIVGDSKSCYRRRDGTWKLDITTTGQATEGIMVVIDNFRGAGTYELDDPYKRYVKVSDKTPVATCDSATNALTGPARNEGKGVMSPGPDSSCNSKGCLLTIANLDQASPNRQRATVECPELCETNSHLVCRRASGPIRFSVEVDCP